MDEFSSKQMDKIIGIVVSDHADDVRQLLLNSGVSLPDNITQQELTVALLKAIKDSESFRQYFADYLTGMVQYEAQRQDSFVSQSGQYLNETGNEEKTAIGQLLSGENLNNLFNTGLGVLADSLSAKSKKESEQRALQAKALDLQIAAQEAEKAKYTASGGIKTGTWILIIVLIIGSFIGAYFLFRKKK